MENVKLPMICRKNCIYALMTLCILFTMFLGMTVTAKASDTTTALSTGTNNETLKMAVERDFTFTAATAGEYNFWVHFSDYTKVNNNNYVKVEYESEDITDNVTTYSAYSDSRRVISLKAGETLTFSLLLYPEDGEFDESDDSTQSILITIGKAHSGDHVLSAPKLISSKTIYNYSYTTYVCKCTKSGCMYCTKWYVTCHGADCVAGTVTLHYNFELNVYGGSSKDTKAFDALGFSPMKEGTDYTIQLKTKATGLGKKGVACIHLKSSKAQKLVGTDFNFKYTVSFTLNLSSTAYTYNGKVKTPSVIGKDYEASDGLFKKNRDFTVTYSSGRKNVGTYKAVVKGKGDYAGCKWTLTFKINPKGTAISSLSAASKAFTVKWKAQKTQTTGYQIRYSLYSTMKNAKTVSVTSNKTTAKKISSLKSKTKYYVQIRTYKTVSGKKYYSSWSAKKAVKTK